MKELQTPDKIIKLTASNPLVRDVTLVRATKLDGKNGAYFHIETFSGKKVSHNNFTPKEFEDFVASDLQGKFKQIAVVEEGQTITYLYNGRTTKRLVRANDVRQDNVPNSQNRQKKYILSEGLAIQPLVDLGVFTKDYKVVNSMYDKYRQINRFVEIIDDKLGTYDKPLTILDFGCGKSYLTFVVYYYFAQIKHVDVRIIGYDLKADVVDNCNKLARKYGYDKLSFIIADVSKDKLVDTDVDAVICLHACDTATDYALDFAVRHNAKFIFAVPCCQHEINKSIHCGGDLDVLLKYGIVKERTCALLTDTIRALTLEDCGYSVDLMEFVDLAHSPKNLMIRAEQTHAPAHNNYEKLQSLKETYGFEQTLFRLVYGKEK